MTQATSTEGITAVTPVQWRRLVDYLGALAGAAERGWASDDPAGDAKSVLDILGLSAPEA